MAESRKIGQLIILPLFFQILIAVSITANEYPFDKAYAESLTNMKNVAKYPKLTFDGIYDIGNAEQPHTLEVAVAHCKGKAVSISIDVTGEKTFYVEPKINGVVTERFSLKNIRFNFLDTHALLTLKLSNEDKKELLFYVRLFTQSDDDDANIEKYAIVQDAITIPQIDSLMKTGSAEGTMEWVKALIEDPPSKPWYNDYFALLSFDTKPMIMTKQFLSNLLQLIQQASYRNKDTSWIGINDIEPM